MLIFIKFLFYIAGIFLAFSGKILDYCQDFPLDERDEDIRMKLFYIRVLLKIADWSQDLGVVLMELGKSIHDKVIA